MEYQYCQREHFCIIGKEGSTRDGADVVRKLWEQANGNFDQIAHLASCTDDGTPAVWGAMTAFSRTFQPWENGFTEGLYLAGVEVSADAKPPEGWVKWTVPAFSYVYAKADAPDAFAQGLTYLAEQGFTLCGAVQEYYCTAEGGQMYLFFPVSRG